MCNHTSSKPTRAQKEVAGLVFAYQTQECVSCGSVLWSSENDSEFSAWLGMQKKDHPDKFVIQKVKVSEDLAKFATEIAHSNCTTESSVYQACLALYFVLGVKRPRLIQTINKLQPENQNTVTRKFRVNPNLYVQIEANAKLFEMDMNEISSWVIQRVLSAAHEGLDSTRDELEFALAA